jgi:hypothetical protein
MTAKRIDLQKTTADWIADIQQYYGKYQIDNLTQVHARGHFAGMSDREILAFADRLAENQKKYPLYF